MNTRADQSSREAASEWQAVPPGTLNNLRGTLQSRRRWTAGLQTASVAAAALLLAMVAWQFLGSTATSPHALSCPECRDLLEGYARHTISPELAQRVHVHLDHCASCRVQYENLLQKVGEGGPASPQLAHQPASAAHRPRGFSLASRVGPHPIAP